MKTDTNNRKRVLFLTNILSPYRITFLNCLAVIKGIDLKVCYAAEQEKDRQWETYHNEIRYSFEILSGFHLSMKNRTIHINRGIWRTIEEFRPHAVVIGTDILSSPVSWMALYAVSRFGGKVIRFEGQHRHTTSSSRLKRFLYKVFYHRCHAFFVYSHLTTEYLQSLGIDRNKITVGYNVGDTEHFIRNVRGYFESQGFVRERQKYPDVMFLFSGRLTPSKNIMNLLEVMRTLAIKDIGIFILGDGELKDQVLEFAAKYPNLNVFYEGFKQKNEVVKYFSLADVFVLPTHYDRASIVLSEALFSGLYTIASVYDGSSVNFIREGLNGVVIDPGDTQQLKDAIFHATQIKKSGAIVKRQIWETMKDYTVSRYAQRLADLVFKL